MWKKVFFLIVLVNYIWATEKVIIYADENYQPYSYMENGQLKGIYIEIVKAIDKNIKEYEIILEPVPWIRGLKMIELGQAYALLPPYYRPVERPYMNYSVPILKEELVVFTIQGKGVNWPKDFINKKIGINRGFSVFKEEDKKFLTVEEANSTEDNVLKLSKGRIDYYVNDRYSILWGISNLVKKNEINQEEAKKIKIVLSLSQEFGYIGYSRSYKLENRNRFEDMVNQEIEKMRKNGEIENIIKNYLENL